MRESIPLPFAVSPEAERFLTQRLTATRTPNVVPHLALVRNLRVRDRAGVIVDRYEGDHFQLGYSPLASLREASEYAFCGRSLFLTADAVAHLSGRVLAFVERPNATRVRHVLVAVDPET